MKNDADIWTISGFERKLLENSSSTTHFLERLSHTILTVKSCNHIRDDTLRRQAVLVAGDNVLVYARSMLNISLLPQSALDTIMEGYIPLGRILAGWKVETGRDNYEYFRVTDDWRASLMFGVSSSFWQNRLWSVCCTYPEGGGRLIQYVIRPRSVVSRSVKSHYLARSYDILSGPLTAAHIEEIFSPVILNCLHAR